MEKRWPRITGWLIAAMFYLVTNVWVYISSGCHHCVHTIGFPLPVFQKFLGSVTILTDGQAQSDGFNAFYLEHLIVNILIIGSSIIGTGLLAESLARKLSRPKIK